VTCHVILVYEACASVLRQAIILTCAAVYTSAYVYLMQKVLLSQFVGCDV